MRGRILLAWVAALVVAGSSTANGGTTCDSCDLNCDAVHDAADIGPFVAALLGGGSGCSACAGDLDASGGVDGRDIQGFVGCLLAPVPVGACCIGAAACALSSEAACAGLWLGAGAVCDPGACAFGNLTAYRPQHGAGYFPFSKTAVGEADEEDAVLGPGIRINAPGDVDPAGEDDLIELLVETTRPGVPIALRRESGALRVWTTRNKAAGTEIAFVNDKTTALPMAGSSLTLWVEWGMAAHGTAELQLQPLAAEYALDTLRFHTFHHIVMALGGESQVPSVPVDPNHGTFVLGIALYQRGFDVHMHDEDDVTADGSGPVYDEVVNAVRNRMVDEVSSFGYSHGGGSTHDLAERLDNDRAGIGVFEIVATSYVDGVQNDSDFDVDQETRRPPSTVYHANQYQVGTLSDFFLDGGPVLNSDPPPTGLNVETTPWGVGATHFTVDDFVQVRSFVETNLAARLTP